MRIIIFTGGIGTRLWPLSRRNSPKQFSQFVQGKSTLQLAMERVKSFGFENIFLATHERYLSLVKAQLPELDSSHIFCEPARRDLAAAVLLTLLRLKQRSITGTMTILWSDHFMDYPDRFVQALRQAESLIAQNRQRLVFLGEEPRFANNQLGWIHIGQADDENVYRFVEWKYRPEQTECQKMFTSGEWLWNLGYFVFDIDFILSLYQQHVPEMYQALSAMVGDEEKIKQNYSKLPALHFDTAILEHIDQNQAIVLRVKLGWSDPGTLYALKEALAHSVEENVSFGNTILKNSRDCLAYNEEAEKLVVTLGLDGLVVINTKNVLLVCAKASVSEITKLLCHLEENGQEQYI